MGGTLYVYNTIKEFLGSRPRPRRNLSKLLLKEMIENRSTSIVGIYGRTGAGKSVYAIKVAYDFYQDWDKVLDYIVFTPFDFQEAVEYLERTDTWVPVLIWDDAGPWLELLKRNSWHPLAIGIRGLFETMRLRVGAILMTMTSERSMPRSIKYNGNLYKFRVRVLRNGYNQNGKEQALVEIQARREKRNEWGSYYWDTGVLYRDYIILRIPNYDEYEVIRKMYIKLYSKLVKASREIAPNKLLDYIYKEWKKMKRTLPRQPFYAKK